MNRNEKLKTLQGALHGQSGPLQLLHRERLIKSMPYHDVHGIIDANNCPPELLDLPATTGERLITAHEEGQPQTTIPLRECLLELADPTKQKYRRDMAMLCIDANDSRFDAVKVNFVKITTRGKWIYQRDVTIGDVRAYHNRSKQSFRFPVFVISFETDMSQYEWQMNRNKTKPL